MKFFHVMPTFLAEAKFVDGMRAKKARLHLEVSDGEVDIRPLSRMKITKAFPNQQYYVGGCQETKVGWFIEIPDELRSISLCFRWEIDLERRASEMTKKIHHDIIFDLLPTDKDGYSMESMTWKNIEDSPLNCGATSVGSLTALSEYRKARTLDSYGLERGVFVIKEHNQITGCNKDDIYWLR
jgi:hypothetical protein